MWIGAHCIDIGVVAIHTGLQPLVEHVADDALPALEGEAVTRPIVGVDVGRADAQEVSDQGTLVVR